MKPRLSLLILVLGLSGCRIGTQAFWPPMSEMAGGARVTLDAGREHIEGELIALGETSFIVRTSDPTRLVQVPFALVRDGEVGMVGSIERMQSKRMLERVRRVSRYPQGLDTELEATLVRAYGLTGVEVLEP